MIERVISGGQTGADQAGWRAARRFGIPCSGWMPRGFLTEDGPRPEFAILYGAREHESPQYPPRTRSNVISARVTIWLGNPHSPGGKATHKAFRDAASDGIDRVWLVVRSEGNVSPDDIAGMIRVNARIMKVSPTINIAGNRESSAPGIGAWVEAYLCEVFRVLGHVERVADAEGERS